MPKPKLVLVDTEPCGDFCEGCTGRACWCQTWERRPVATPQKRMKGKKKPRLVGKAPTYTGDWPNNLEGFGWEILP